MMAIIVTGNVGCVAGQQAIQWDVLIFFLLTILPLRQIFNDIISLYVKKDKTKEHGTIRLVLHYLLLVRCYHLHVILQYRRERDRSGIVNLHPIH